MTRWIVYPLSTTVALMLATIAPATAQQDVSVVGDRNQSSVAEATHPVRGIIVPHDNGPSNRVAPQAAPVEADLTQRHARAERPQPTEGIIVPDDTRPYNRAVPDRGALENAPEATAPSRPEPTQGMIVPDDTSPYNRAWPRSATSKGR